MTTFAAQSQEASLDDLPLEFFRVLCCASNRENQEFLKVLTRNVPSMQPADMV